MTLPLDEELARIVPPIPERIELFLHLREPAEWALRLLGRLSTRPFQHASARKRERHSFGYGHTYGPIGSDMPSASSFRYLLFLPPQREDPVSYKLDLLEEEVRYLWVVPITEDEFAEKQAHGWFHVDPHFQRTPISVLADPSRDSILR